MSGNIIQFKKCKEVAKALKAIDAQENKDATKEKAKQVIEKLHEMTLVNAA